MEQFTFAKYNINPKEKNNENVNKNTLSPLKMKILVVYLFSGAIYNIEIHAKMSLNMEHCIFMKYNVNHIEESTEQINISCRFSLKKAKKNIQWRPLQCRKC
jgi:hypothetical protein